MSRPETLDAQPSDAELMQLVGQGDMAAFGKLVERHQSLVIGTVGRMLGNNSDVEDVAQQVFIRVWKSAPRYQPTAKFTTWLLTITRNLVFNESRRRKRHPAGTLDVHEGEEPLALPDHARRMPDKALLESELQGAIDEAIGALPEKQRLAVVLRRYEEKSYEEIADVLELSVPAVKSVLFRARGELRNALQAYLQR
ncbi:MAG: sigma-70 family RNA polymerase sigma factor [Verrucomicrobiota bacterium]